MSEVKSQLDVIHDKLEKLRTYQNNVLLDLSSVSRADLESYVQSHYFNMPIDTSGTLFDAIETHKFKMNELFEQETSLRRTKWELESKLHELERR